MSNRSHVGSERPRGSRPPRPVVPGPVRVAREALSDGARVERLSRIFRALGEPTRSKLVLALSIHEMCVKDLASTLGTTASATSHQLRILRDLDIVHVRRAGKTQVYALNERAFGFCAPRVCQAWRQTLAPIESSPGATRRPRGG